MNTTAQIIGIVAMTANIVSFQCRQKKNVLLLQLIGGALFSVHMFMLNAPMGGFLNFLAVLRAVAYLKPDLSRKTKYLFCGIFLFLFALSYLLVFTVFGTEPTPLHLITELLPLIGMSAMTVGFSQGDARAIRIFGLINSPCWLIYNCINFSIGGILCEVVSLFSIISAYLRLDIKK